MIQLTMTMKKAVRYIAGLLVVASVTGCGVKYGFTGGSIPEGMTTYTVQFFENTAPIVNPTLSQTFTEALKERIRSQSSLSQVTNEGDAIFEGRKIGRAHV